MSIMNSGFLVTGIGRPIRSRSHNDGHLEAVPEGVMGVLLLHRYTTVPYNWNITEEEVAKVHSS